MIVALYCVEGVLALLLALMIAGWWILPAIEIVYCAYLEHRLFKKVERMLVDPKIPVREKFNSVACLMISFYDHDVGYPDEKIKSMLKRLREVEYKTGFLKRS